MKKVQLNLCNFSLFSPQAQNLSCLEGTLVFGDKLSKLGGSQVDFLSLSHSLKEPVISLSNTIWSH